MKEASEEKVLAENRRTRSKRKESLRKEEMVGEKGEKKSRQIRGGGERGVRG